MRKIVCDACKNRYGDYAIWVVHKNVLLCESCRLAAIEYWREDLGFGFFSHVWIDMFMGVEPKSKGIKNKSGKQS